MALYKNDYSKSEDPMMWGLHQIRHKMAKKKLNFSEINRLAIDFKSSTTPLEPVKTKRIKVSL